MSLREIKVLGDPILRKKAHRVTQFNESLATLVQDMVETMRQSDGVGLAAPQVGLRQRVIVVETPNDPDEPQSGQLYAVVNPEIVRASQEQVDGIEGCLSIPGYVGEVTRHAAITIKGQDIRGRKVRIKLQGFPARAFQHEIDHLEGILYIDRLTAPDRIWRVEEGAEEQAEVPAASVEMTPAFLQS
jgi:peptide deformylase